MASVIPSGCTDRVPRPILATKKHNTTLSDLCDDVLLLICDHLDRIRSESEIPRKNLSLTSHRFNDLLSSDLFKTLRINAPLKLLAECQLYHYHAQTLKVDMFGSLWWWCSGIYVSGDDVTDLFRLISKLPHLRCLEFRMMSRSIDLFEAVFDGEVSADLFVLPSVENLIVTNSATFLTRHCPNLKSLVIQDGGECLVEVYSSIDIRLCPVLPMYAGGKLPSETLTSLDAIATWTVNELGYLVKSFPNLRHVTMRSETYCYRARIDTITEILGKGLKDLQSLKLSKIGHLDMGFRSLWKRKIYECKPEEHRKRLWQENEVRRVQAENLVARLAFGANQSLRECWIGEKRVAKRMMSRDSCTEGVHTMKWLWRREQEDIDDCSTGAEWAKYRAEREAVVVLVEEGT
ncbi:hypothetical protein ACN47E_005619 [Coniothyrium glycines]